MSGNLDQQPSLNLPPVGGENPNPAGSNEAQPQLPPEHAAVFEANQNSATQALPPFPILPTDDTPPPPPPPVTDDTAIAQPLTTSAMDQDDQDVIPKEWVIKAKHIIERTREDPYSQNNEFTKFKASYIKERYGMTVKADSE